MRLVRLGRSRRRPSVISQLTTLLTANGLKADVSFLASDLLEGRGTPSRGLDLAAEYIAAQFRRAGLEPVGDDGYFQTANFATVTPNTDGLELSLDAGGNVVKAASAALVLQDPAATDLTHAPAIKVAMDNPAAIAALTADQVNGKVLVMEAGAQPAGVGRGRGAAGFGVARGLKPAAVIVLQAGGAGGRGGAGAGRGGARPRETSSIPAFATLACTDARFSRRVRCRGFAHDFAAHRSPENRTREAAQRGRPAAWIGPGVEGYVLDCHRTLRPFGHPRQRHARSYL